MPKPSPKGASKKDKAEPQPVVVPADPVEEASEESFPASDSPGWIGEDQDPQYPKKKKAAGK